MRTVGVYIENETDATPQLLVSFPSNLQGGRVVPVYCAIQDAVAWAIANIGLGETQIDEFTGGYLVFNNDGVAIYLRVGTVNS